MRNLKPNCDAADELKILLIGAAISAICTWAHLSKFSLSKETLFHQILLDPHSVNFKEKQIFLFWSSATKKTLPRTIFHSNKMLVIVVCSSWLKHLNKHFESSMPQTTLLTERVNWIVVDERLFSKKLRSTSFQWRSVNILWGISLTFKFYSSMPLTPTRFE